MYHTFMLEKCLKRYQLGIKKKNTRFLKREKLKGFKRKMKINGLNLREKQESKTLKYLPKRKEKKKVRIPMMSLKLRRTISPRIQQFLKMGPNQMARTVKILKVMTVNKRKRRMKTLRLNLMLTGKKFQSRKNLRNLKQLTLVKDFQMIS